MATVDRSIVELKMLVGTSKLICGTKANVDSAPVTVSADTSQVGLVLLQVDPDNTSGVFVGSDTTNLFFQLLPGQDITLPVNKLSNFKVKGVGADTNVTVNFLAPTII